MRSKNLVLLLSLLLAQVLQGFAFAQGAPRLDDLLRSNGLATVAYTGSDAGQGNSQLRLTAMGVQLDVSGAARYTVWQLRNSDTKDRWVRFDAPGSAFSASWRLRPRSETYVRSPIVSGTATHRLSEGATVIASVPATNTAFVQASSPTLPTECNALGRAGDFNGFFLGNFTAQSSDVQGRLAAAGNISLTNYSIADQLTALSAGQSLIAGGDLSFASGRLYFGSALAGGETSGVGAPVINGLSADQSITSKANLPFDFAAERAYLQALSTAVAALPANGTWQQNYGGLYLHGSGSAALQVFQIPAATVQSSHTFAVDGLPAGATVVFNITGASAQLANFSLESLAAIRSRVLFNFPQATTLTLTSIGIEGSILAPLADINTPQGVVKGTVVAKSWNGIMQLNHEPFRGCGLPRINQAPVFLTQPSTMARVGETYRYAPIVIDPDNDVVTTSATTSPSGMSVSNGEFRLVPTAAQIGTHAVALQANDGHGATTAQNYTLRVTQDFCPIYPITVPASLFTGATTGQAFNNVARGSGAGNFGWLSWAGSPSAPTLAQSLVPPGDSYTYINPDNASDHVAHINDFIGGATGSMNANAVRDAMTSLLGRDILIPAWSTTRGNGANLAYKTASFARIRLSAFSLTGQGTLSFTYQGAATCYNHAPTAQARAISTAQNTSVSVTLLGTDPDNDTLTYAIALPPTHGTLSGTAPNLTYTPAVGYVGSDRFTYTVADAEFTSEQAVVDITITGASNHAPVALDQGSVGEEDVALPITLSATDADGDALTYTVIAAPEHGTLSGTAPALIYTPNANFFGNDAFTFQASDGTATSNTAKIDIDIKAINDAPTAQPRSLSLDQGASAPITLGGTDIDGDALTYRIVTPPAHGTLSGTAPSLSFTANAAYSGADGFTYVVNDGTVDSAPVAVTITIRAVNRAPTATAQAVHVNEDGTLAITLAGSDPDGDALSFAVTLPPTQGTLTGTAPTLTYTPAANYHGTDSLRFTVSDGALTSGAATVSITVDPINDAPIATAQTPTFDEDTATPITLVGEDLDGDTLTYRVVTPPTHGTLSGTAPALTYTPNANYHGGDAFTFVVNDGTVDSAAASVTITIRAINDAPSATTQALTLDEDASLAITLAGEDLDGDALTFRVTTLPTHGTLSGTAPALTYTPSANYHGEDSFAFVASDGVADSVPATVAVTIASINDAPTIKSTPPTTGSTGSAFAYTVIASDADGDALSYSLSTQPSGASIDVGTGQITWTPAANQSGNQTFTVRVEDGQGGSVTQSFTVNVTRANAAPTITTTPTSTINESATFTYDVDATDPDAGDVLSYQMPRAPTGATIASGTGLLQWQAGSTYAQSIRRQDLACRHPALDKPTSLEVMWYWSGSTQAPTANQMLSTPMVAPLSDTNGDGKVDTHDRVAILANAYVASHFAGGVLHAIDGVTGQTLWAVTTPGYETRPPSSPAVADIDHDGFPEIIVPSDDSGLIAVEHDGTPKWHISQNQDFGWGAPAIGDLNGDGNVEIVVGKRAFNAQGQLLWTANVPENINHHPLSIIADLEGDGQAEVIFNGAIINADGSVRRQFDARDYQENGLADFTGDGLPEIVSVYDGVKVYRANGTLLWESQGGPRLGSPGGPPAIGDFDGDGLPEVGVAGKTVYNVYDTDGRFLWSRDVQDFSSAISSSTAADINGDGIAEILYSDEQNFWVFDGRTGGTVYSVANLNGTAHEYPVFADINNDGAGEILVTSSAIGHLNTAPNTGLRAFKGKDRPLLPTRALWNEHSYYIDNINDDLSVRTSDVGTWARHNTFRLNDFPDRHALGMIDLTAFDTRIDPTRDDRVLTRVVNRGLWPAELAFSVKLYAGDPGAGGVLLGTKTVNALAVNASIDLAFDGIDLTAVHDDLYVRVDSDNVHAECLEDNNLVRTPLFQARAVDNGGLFDAQWFTVNVENLNQAPSITTASLPATRTDNTYVTTIATSDPDVGDDVFFALTQAPTGMTIDPISGEIRWTPAPNQAGTQSVTARVTDIGGLSATRSWQIDVALNHRPRFITQPIESTPAGAVYTYTARAVDDDGEPLTYTLPQFPAGVTFDAATATIRWTPSASQQGLNDFVLRVDDTQGGFATQQFKVAVTVSSNHAPVFTSTPGVQAEVGSAYAYTAQASDADGDTLSYSLALAPAGMTIQAASGSISWTPTTAQLGTQVVIVRVSDGQTSAEQAFQIGVSSQTINHPPVFTSTPSSVAVVGQPCAYTATATDEDGDSITFAIANAPEGATINATSGALSWTPTAAQVGARTFTLEARDARGAVATQTFTLTVNDNDAGNHPPVISTSAPLAATVGVAYAYDLNATDADGDTLSYALTTSPAGMSIDALTGAIAWTPSVTQIGSHEVEVSVNDGHGATGTQHFTLVVSAANSNHAPTVTSTPAPNARATREYQYNLDATDEDGDTLTYTLTTAPAGMSIDAATGLIRWTPVAEGSATVTARVADAQAFIDQTWTITVSAATGALTATVTATPNLIAPGEPVSLLLQYTCAAGAVTRSLTVDGATVVLNAAGEASFTSSVIGRHVVEGSVTDPYDTATATTEFFVSDPSDTEPPVVELLSPTDASEISAPTPVRGTVTDAALANWKLFLRPANTPDAVATVLAQGSNTFTAQDFARFDPTLMLNGQYALILQATDTSGRVSSDSAVVIVSGDMKVGHFSITFEDVSVPLAGIPVRVLRTYDTRRKSEKLDFGYGWSLDYQNVRVHESRRLGFSWRVQEINDGFFVKYCVVPAGDPTVTVTLPDGDVETFHAKAVPECSQIQPEINVHLEFEPGNRTRTKLKQTSYGLVRVATVGNNVVSNIVDPEAPTVPIDPTTYELTTADGMVYKLDQTFGIRQVVDPNGNTLNYSNSGIVHSSGVGIQFVRDAQNRIEDMILPDGKLLSYTYTAQGDLQAMSDQLNQVTQYTYETVRLPHYLRDIIDPRGVRVSRNEYDDDGRLIATIDADGHRIEMHHDIDGRSESVRDRRGNTTVHLYDDRGRVLASTNALSETTHYTYDADDNVLTETDPLGHVTTYTYDAQGNRLTETNALGEVTTSTFDNRNHLLTQVDALGRTVMANTYNPNSGALLTTTDAVGNTTEFGYDSGIGSTETGELTSLIDAAGNTTTYFLNPPQYWRTKETDALGHITHMAYNDMGRVIRQTRERTVANVAPGAAAKGRTPQIAKATVTETTTTTYDDKGRVVRVDQPDGSFTTTQYDGNDKPTHECDSANRCTVTTYDARGNVSRIDYSDGTYETKTYDENGNVIAETDRQGHTTRMVYDAADRLIETIQPDTTPGTDADNPRTTTSYDAAGRVIASTDELGRITRYEYDDAGRRTKVIQSKPDGSAGDGPTTTTEYDASGRRTAMVDALGHRTTYRYDDAGKLLETTFHDGTSVSTVYDELGRKISETDQAGRITQYGYDELGRLIDVTLPPANVGDAPSITRYTYDEWGNRITQTDAAGRVTRWTHDSQGREITRTLPLGQRESMQYDLLGNRVSSTDFRGRVVGYTYDDQNRLTGIDYPTDHDATMTYTPEGQRATAIDGRGTSSWGYDERHRLVTATDAEGRTITYTYDKAGNLLSRVSPAATHTYTYDALNRLSTVTATVAGDAPRVTRYTYDAVGNRATMTGAEGTQTVYSYDDLNRLTHLVKRTAANAPLFEATYTLDPSGMRTHVAENDDQGHLRDVTWTYDGQKRLTGEAISHRDATVTRNATWAYDTVGNRLTQTIVPGVGPMRVTTYTYDDNDRLLTESEQIGSSTPVQTLYAYDAQGNTTGKSKPGELMEYAYDDANRMVEFRSGGNRTTYEYNVDGIRMAQTTFSGSTSTETQYLVDGNHAYAQVAEEWISENNASAKLGAVFSYGDDIISQVRCTPNSATTCANASYSALQADGFGSTRKLTNQDGTVIGLYEYSGWGETIHESGTSTLEHKYRGEQEDANSAQYYLRARYLNPGTGRFLQQDPLWGSANNPFSLQRYGYSEGDPLGKMDPNGMAAVNLEETQVVANLQLQLGRSVVVPIIETAANGTIRYSLEGYLKRRIIASLVAGAGTAILVVAKVYVEKCIRTGRCEIGTPIVNTGSNIPEHSQHIDDSQNGMGSNGKATPIFLNYGPRNPVDYNNTGHCNEYARGIEFVEKAVCDEYPFATTSQGGQENYDAGKVSLKLLPFHEMSLQRDLLRDFYRANRVSPDGSSSASRFISLAYTSLPSGFSLPNGAWRTWP